MDKLKCMEILVRVVDAGSFTAAARQWGLSKAVVSKSVAQLEAHLGVALLQRSTRSMSVTEAGQRYVQACRDVLDRVAAADTALEAGHGELSGSLRVSAPSGLFADDRAAVLADFVARYPRVALELVMTNRILDVVGAGIDCAIRVTAPHDSALIGHKLAAITSVLVASPSYRAAHGVPEQLSALAHHVCMCDRGLLAHPEMPRRGDAAGVLFANDPMVLRSLALRGQGIAHVPRMLVQRDLDAGRLEVVLDGAFETPRTMWIVYSQRRFLSARARAFIDHVRRTLPPTLG